MARPKRIQIPGLVRHVMARGNGRMRIFEDDKDYRSFILLLGTVVQDFEIECLNYCLMPNHYHVTLRPSLPNLSGAMRHLNGIYAQRWNRRHGHVGHVFQGRFKDQIVQREGYLPALCRYIARNPWRARLVQRPEEWRWSSYGATIGVRPQPAFLEVTQVLKLFGDEHDARLLRARFRDYVLADPDEDLEGRLRSQDRVIGDQSFRAALVAGASAAPPSL